MAKKTINQKERDLEDAVNFLREFLNKVNEHDWKYIKALSGQLRALVCEGSRSLNPLLLNIAKEKGVNLECYASSWQETLDKTPSLKKAITMAFIPPTVVSSTPIDRPMFRRKQFKKWLTEPLLILDNRPCSANDIIRLVAEKEGGAHYDDALPEHLTKAKGMVFHKGDLQFNQIEATIVSVAKYVIEASEKILGEK